MTAGAEAPTTERPVIQLAAVARTYPGTPPVPALRPADITIASGEYIAVVGPSGSGKSTFLNLVGLLDRPTAGSLRLNGVDVGALSERDRTALRGRRIGFVFQSFHLLPYRTATENVMLALTYDGTHRGHRRAAAHAALHRVGLDHRRDALPTTMSGGERQRVAIARALVSNPALLLCDEPTGNLDSATAGAILDLLAELHAAGLTILVITHDPVVARHADRIITILDGTLDASATSDIPVEAGV